VAPARSDKTLNLVKEDVLEQIVDDYLKFQGYFTAHNVPFRPRRDHLQYDASQDAVPSDIDVVGIDPRRRGVRRVVVINCKAWQRGFPATALLEQLRGNRPDRKRARWRQFRELWIPKWSEAFREEIKTRTGATRFNYRIAVTYLRGDGDEWGKDPTIRRNLPGCLFEFLTLEEMWKAVLADPSRTPAASEIGRLAQLLKAATLTTAEAGDKD
jgi:hypothetical protein